MRLMITYGPVVVSVFYSWLLNPQRKLTERNPVELGRLVRLPHGRDHLVHW